MKKVLLVFLCFSLTACFIEPKKEVIIESSINEKIDSNKTEEKYSTEQSEVISVTLLEEILELPIDKYKVWIAQNNYEFVDEVTNENTMGGENLSFKKDNIHYTISYNSKENKSELLTIFSKDVNVLASLLKEFNSLGYKKGNRKGMKLILPEGKIIEYYNDTYDISTTLSEKDSINLSNNKTVEPYFLRISKTQ
ncbi:hypothetical protein QLS31_11265 [Flavobacterium sp. XS2P24]|uniref:hypothetical protein n=1 Tax=Flavobacterium sp. XS2P24 TaxID=3041249 RepID=UPI0024A882C7|nr:hypothetical protein [Flavobacterium sp. XS2P24]MDI6050412.1 hypothetical protein [Flavobacterium sp. XS2P24]